MVNILNILIKYEEENIMTLEYDVNKDKDAETASVALKRICALVEKKEEVSTEGRPRKITRGKYLCPCGIVDIVSDKMEQPSTHKISIKSDKCGI